MAGACGLGGAATAAGAAAARSAACCCSCAFLDTDRGLALPRELTCMHAPTTVQRLHHLKTASHVLRTNPKRPHLLCGCLRLFRRAKAF